MKIIITMAFFFIAIHSYSQERIMDSILKSKIYILTTENIDTLAIIKRHCESMVTPKCGYTFYYILWTKNNITFIQRLNDCDTGSIKMDSTNYFFNFYSENKSKINSEEVKRYQTESGGLVFQDHYCESTIYFILNENKIEKQITSYYLEQGEGNILNKNYQFNNSLKIVELDKNIRTIMKKLFN